MKHLKLISNLGSLEKALCDF